MTGGCASLPALDEKFMRRPNENQRAALKTRLPRGEIYFRLRHTARRRDHYYCVQEQLENLCTGTHCEPQRGRNKFMVVGLAAPVSSISAAPTFAAAAQNFNSRAVDLKFLCESCTTAARPVPRRGRLSDAQWEMREKWRQFCCKMAIIYHSAL